jgi:hypothetical protein
MLRGLSRKNLLSFIVKTAFFGCRYTHDKAGMWMSTSVFWVAVGATYAQVL